MLIIQILRINVHINYQKIKLKYDDVIQYFIYEIIRVPACIFSQCNKSLHICPSVLYKKKNARVVYNAFYRNKEFLNKNTKDLTDILDNRTYYFILCICNFNTSKITHKT